MNKPIINRREIEPFSDGLNLRVTTISEAKRENLIWIDVIRILASLGVVLIHVAADVITEFKAVPMGQWWAAHIYDSLVRGCVALFVMVSGALLLMPSDETAADFFKKRAGRILIPFFVWTALYLIWKKVLFLPDLGLAEALSRAAGNKVHFHLWFFYALIGIYLATPILRIFVSRARPRDLVYFILLWFFFASLMPFIEGLVNLLWHAKFHLKIPVNIAEGLIGYFLLGYFLRIYATEKSAGLAWAFWAGSLGVCLVGSYFLNLRLGHYHALFYESTAPNVAVYVASVFLIIKSFAGPLARLPENKQKIILLLSKASFGIYLIHPMIMEAVEKGRWGFALAPRMHPPAVMILATTAVVYLISFCAVLLIQRIPYLKRVV